MPGVRPEPGSSKTCSNPNGPDPDRCSKYCSDHPWKTPCEGCGEEIEVTYGMMEVIGAYHSGCFGYPMCDCIPSHKGDCPPKVKP